MILPLTRGRHKRDDRILRGESNGIGGSRILTAGPSPTLLSLGLGPD